MLNPFWFEELATHEPGKELSMNGKGLDRSSAAKGPVSAPGLRGEESSGTPAAELPPVAPILPASPPILRRRAEAGPPLQPLGR